MKALRQIIGSVLIYGCSQWFLIQVMAQGINSENSMTCVMERIPTELEKVLFTGAKTTDPKKEKQVTQVGPTPTFSENMQKVGTQLNDVPVTSNAKPTLDRVYLCMHLTEDENNRTFLGQVDSRLDKKPTTDFWSKAATRESISVKVDIMNETMVDWTLIDILGNIVLQQKKFAVKNGRIEFLLSNTAHLREGIYLLHVEGADYEYTQKLMVN
jgi:hypothetical protein